MARPIKDGVDYFPFDVDFFQGKKIRILKSEFGAKGITVLIALFCEIYRTHGYYLKWDDDDCFIMADAVGCGCTPEHIKQVVQGCLRRSVFDDRVFQVFGVLTSAGIQRRYIRMLNSRTSITIIQEYWLLNNENSNDVPTGVLDKITFFSVSGTENAVSGTENPDKNTENPLKEKENKRKESKGKEKSPFGDFSDDLREKMEEWLKYKSERRESYKPTGLHSLVEQVKKHRQTATDEQICALVETCMANGWKGIIWDRLPGKDRPQKPQNQSARTGSYHSLDVGELENLIRRGSICPQSTPPQLEEAAGSATIKMSNNCGS